MKEANETFNKAKFYFDAAIINIKNLNFDAAENNLLNSLEIIPNRVSTIYYLIQIYYHLKNEEKLDSLLKKKKDLINHNEIKFGYACLNFLKKNYRSSLEICKKILLPETKKDEKIKIFELIAENYRKQGEFLKSFQYLRMILNLGPNYAIYHNIGLLLSTMGKTNSALKFFLKCKELNPNYDKNLVEISFCYLKKGKLELGFNLYDSRYSINMVKNKFSNIKSPTSLEGLVNKKILVWSEQGLGDTIMFSRFVLDLYSITKNITFVVQNNLLNLLKFIHRDINIIDEASLFKYDNYFDYQISMCSLPKLLKIRSISDIKFHHLKIHNNKKLDYPQNKLNIGFTWFGNTNYANDEYRSIPFNLLEKILNLKNINFYKLSKGLKTCDLLEYYKFNIKDLGDYNFLDLSNHMENLDLIISSDTSIAHLAGILNLKCILLLNYNPDWRWFNDNQTTPWYPSIKIIKQVKNNKWDSVLESLEVEINNCYNKKFNKRLS